jgi:hypothetical protein
VPSADTSSLAARTVGGYELLRVIGRGGMATVYLARQPDLNRLVALKELGGLRAPEPSFAKRFVREARVAGALSHPNIVTVHEYFEHDGTPYIAMEFVPGGTLRPHMRGMSLAETAGVLENVLAGLAHAEEHGIVHRDLKPENLMVTSSGRVKIADFGIAKATGALQTGSFRTETGTAIGTPSYIAPEQAMGEDVGPWTDLYSIGIMTFEMLVGRTPFYDSDSPMAIVLRHLNESVPSVSELVPGVDPEVSDWVGRLLVKDPSRRTQSAVDAWDEFEDLAIGILGARWRDGSALVGLPATDETMPLLPTRVTRTTRALRAAGEATTMPHRERLAAVAEPPPRQRSRRTPVAVLTAMTLLAIVAAAAAFAGGGSGGGSASGGSGPTTSIAAAPVAASQTRPAAAPTDSEKKVLDDLSRSSARDEAKLAAAGSQGAQVRGATALAVDYETAAGQLPSETQPQVVMAVRQIAAMYRKAAASAATGDSSAFDAAGVDITNAQQALDNALAGVPASSPGPATQAPATTTNPGSSGNSGSSGSSGSSSSSGGSGGSGGPNENEPDENDNGD